MVAVATFAGAAQSSATTCNVTSVTIGASDTNVGAFVHGSVSGGIGTLNTAQWKPTGTPEGLTIESNGTFFSGDARNAMAALHSPSTGTDTVRSTFSSAPDEHSCQVYTFTGGASATRTPPTAATGTSATPAITNGNVQSGDAILWGYSGVENDLGGDTINVLHNTGQSQGNDNGFAYIGVGCSYEQATSTSETGGGTFQVSATNETCQWRCISMAIQASGGTTFNKTVTGSITPTGALVRTVETVIEGSITAIGSILTQIGVTVEGSITASGSLIKQTQTTVAGVLTVAGALTKQIGVILAGSTTPSGSILKHTAITNEGSSTPAGALISQLIILQSVAGSILMAGAVAGVVVAGVVGSLLRQVLRPVLRVIQRRP